MDLWLRYRLIIIAIATAASAAAMVIINREKNTPFNLSGYRYLLNATKLMFTLFNISSIDISIVMRLRRVNNPYMPIKNRAVLTNKICVNGMLMLFFLLQSNRWSPLPVYLKRHLSQPASVFE